MTRRVNGDKEALLGMEEYSSFTKFTSLYTDLWRSARSPHPSFMDMSFWLVLDEFQRAVSNFIPG